MIRKTAQLWLLVAIIFCTFSIVQAQQQLALPMNFRIADDTLVWDEVENASSYRVRWLGFNAQDFVSAEVAQNKFSLSGLDYGGRYYVSVKALSGDPAAYQDSGWSPNYILQRPWPTATPTNTPTDTPTPTPTRVVLRGLRTPQNLRLLSGATVAWDAVAEAIGYKLLLSGDGAQHLITVDAPQTEYTFTNLRLGVGYAVLVSALGDGRIYESQGRWSSFIRISLPIATTDRPTATHTITNTPTESPTNTATSRPTATVTATEMPSATSTATPTPRPTNTSTYTPTATVTATETPSATSTATPTPRPTNTSTYTPTATNTATDAFTPTSRPTSTVTDTPTATDSPTATLTDPATSTQTALKKLPAPKNFRVLPGNTVAWDAVEGADRYRLRLDAPNAIRILKRVNPPQTQYTFENLQAGLVYKARVRAMGDEVVYKLGGVWSVTLDLIPGATVEPTATETVPPTDRPTNTATFTPTDAPSNTPTDRPTATPTNTATFTPTDRPSNTPTDTPTNTATFTPTDIPTNTPTDTPPPTNTPAPTETDTPVPLCELSRPGNLMKVAEMTVAWNAVENAAGYRLRWRLTGNDWLTTRLSVDHRAYQFAELQVGVPYEVQVQALGDGVTCEEEGEWSRALPFTLLPTATPTDTPTNTPTFTPTNTPTDTPTHTPTFTPTDTPIPTDTPTNTATYTPTFTPTNTPTFTPIPTDTPTFTPTYTLTLTPVPPTATPIPPTATNTPTFTPTSIPTATNTPKPTKTKKPDPPKTKPPTHPPTQPPPTQPPPTQPPPTQPPPTPPQPTDSCGPSDWETFSKETHVTSNIPVGANVCICTQQCKRKRCQRSGATFAESCGECSIGSCY